MFRTPTTSAMIQLPAGLISSREFPNRSLCQSTLRLSSKDLISVTRTSSFGRLSSCLSLVSVTSAPGLIPSLSLRVLCFVQ